MIQEQPVQPDVVDDYVNAQRKKEILACARTGVPPSKIAEAYNVPVAYIQNMITADAALQTNGGLRFDSGKPRFDLIPPEPMLALANHFAVGALKYAERNWELGMNWGRCFRSTMSHLWKWLGGEEFDDETGSHHLICAAWNCFVLYAYWARGVGKDDRAKTMLAEGQKPMWKPHQLETPNASSK